MFFIIGGNNPFFVIANITLYDSWLKWYWNTSISLPALIYPSILSWSAICLTWMFVVNFRLINSCILVSNLLPLHLLFILLLFFFFDQCLSFNSTTNWTTGRLWSDVIDRNNFAVLCVQSCRSPVFNALWCKPALDTSVMEGMSPIQFFFIIIFDIFRANYTISLIILSFFCCICKNNCDWRMKWGKILHFLIFQYPALVSLTLSHTLMLFLLLLLLQHLIYQLWLWKIVWRRDQYYYSNPCAKAGCS